MAIINFVVAFALAYIVFMFFGYVLAKIIFPKLDGQEEEARKQKQMVMMKAKRTSVKRNPRMVHERMIRA